MPRRRQLQQFELTAGKEAAVQWAVVAVAVRLAVAGAAGVAVARVIALQPHRAPRNLRRARTNGSRNIPR